MSSAGLEVFRADLHAILAARRALGDRYDPAVGGGVEQMVEELTEGRDW
ncbi:MAG TPA: hypothetical protein VGO86_14310 [Candidatus Dormibacteraeota bacterium]